MECLYQGNEAKVDTRLGFATEWGQNKKVLRLGTSLDVAAKTDYEARNFTRSVQNFWD